MFNGQAIDACIFSIEISKLVSIGIWYRVFFVGWQFAHDGNWSKRLIFFDLYARLMHLFLCRFYARLPASQEMTSLLRCSYAFTCVSVWWWMLNLLKPHGMAWIKLTTLFCGGTFYFTHFLHCRRHKLLIFNHLTHWQQQVSWVATTQQQKFSSWFTMQCTELSLFFLASHYTAQWKRTNKLKNREKKKRKKNREREDEVNEERQFSMGFAVVDAFKIVHGKFSGNINLNGFITHIYVGRHSDVGAGFACQSNVHFFFVLVPDASMNCLIN